MRTIIDNNILIAEFMGYTKATRKEAGANLVNEVYEWYLKDVGYYYINGDYHAEDYLLFHLDWNWLMNAVIKCKELEFFGGENLIKNIEEALVKADIDEVYRAVIEFINKYE